MDKSKKNKSKRNVSPIVSDNRKARHDFFIEDKFEAGVALLGWEVKSARAGTVNLQDAYIYFKTADSSIEAFLRGAHFSPYTYGILSEQDTRRDRKLLLRISEIQKIYTAVKTKGYTCVPTKIYFNNKGLVKVEIALARGKHKYDKKKAIKERDIARETQRELK